MEAQVWAQVLFATLLPLTAAIFAVVVRTAFKQGQTAATMESNTRRLDAVERKVDEILRKG